MTNTRREILKKMQTINDILNNMEALETLDKTKCDAVTKIFMQQFLEDANLYLEQLNLYLEQLSNEGK